jgi:hypothetical protein
MEVLFYVGPVETNLARKTVACIDSRFRFSHAAPPGFRPGCIDKSD